jgi:PAS domain S-box-containing protein
MQEIIYRTSSSEKGTGKKRATKLRAIPPQGLTSRQVLKEIANYKYALDQAAIVAITDQKGIILYANDNFCNISKYSKEELLGKDHRIINSGHHPPSYIKNMWVTIANGRIWRGEFLNRAKDGECYWVDTTIIPFLDEKGKPYQYLSIRNDISEKKRVQEELSKSETRLKEAQTIAHIGNYDMDLAKNVHIWSDEFFRIIGLTKPETTPGLDLFLSFIHPGDAAVAKNMICDAFQSSKNSNLEFRFIRKDGAVRFAFCEFRFEFDKKGIPIRLYGILQDITLRKEAEDKLKKLQEDLLEQKRKEQIKLTATALEAQEKERTAIGIELHDNVNQILVGCLLAMSMIKEDPAKVHQFSDIVITNIKEAIEENRKIAHAFVTPNMKSEKLTGLLKKLFDKMLKPTGVTTKILFSKFEEDRLEDKQKINIYRIAQEQCTNIAKYAQASEVKISLATTVNAFVMQISDNGVGMSKNDKVNGIGLQNIMGRLSIFNGTSSIETGPGKGFRLEVKIPL